MSYPLIAAAVIATFVVLYVLASRAEIQERLTALMDETPSALRLRELSTLVEIAAEKNSTILFPMPVELQRLATALEHAVAPAVAAADGPAGGAELARDELRVSTEPHARIVLDRSDASALADRPGRSS
jgi:hypothetical protein